MRKIKVDGVHDFLIEKIKNQLLINGEKKEFDIIKHNENEFLILHENKPYMVNILCYDATNNVVNIKVNEHVHNVELRNKSDILLERIGIQKKQTKKSSELRAPMPGLIVDIKVYESQNVRKGEPLIILKAMKMENILRSPTEATIKQILVEKNQKVEKDYALIQF